ncbi:MAG: cbb3-type cytochrome oxidase assembly protein CcoS [Verrucomicrobia bacterium]|nr:cbb3-type cytochrome oxidase assembly protein CcoS [Verrucomicrobiota bacterium]
MSVILILILASLVMATLFLFGFIWSVRSGQYEDTLTPSMRVLMEETGGVNPEHAHDSRLPLTLTFSRREREQQARASDLANARPAISDSRHLQNLTAILPLPAGEGRGEGEPDKNQRRSLASEHSQPKK